MLSPENAPTNREDFSDTDDLLQVSSSTSGAVNPKSSNFDPNKVFVAITFAIMILELSSAAFSLSLKYHPNIKQYINIKALTIALFSLFILANLAMIIQTVNAVKDTNKEYKKGEIDKTHRNIKYSKDAITLIASLIYTSSLIIAIIMAVRDPEIFPVVNLVNLGLCILAPLCGVISGALRIGDTLKDQNKEKKSTNQLPLSIDNKLLMALCCISFTFELVHFACHVVEAIQLNGCMQDLYEFDNIPVISLQIVISLLFIITFVAEQFIENQNNKKPPSNQPGNDNNRPSPSTTNNKPKISPVGRSAEEEENLTVNAH